MLGICCSRLVRLALDGNTSDGRDWSLAACLLLDWSPRDLLQPFAETLLRYLIKVSVLFPEARRQSTTTRRRSPQEPTMRWKLLRFPHDGTRGRIPIPGLYRPRRSVSTLSSKDESIAAILAREPSEETGQVVPILVTGSVRTVRKQKRHCFLEIGDGSTSRTLQAILEPQLAEG